MTTKDNIIFFVILSVVITGVLALLYIGEYMGSDGKGKPLLERITSSQDDETHKGKKSVIDNITTIIIALGTPITILYGIPSYREKMRKNRIDILKDRMLLLFSEGWDHRKVHTAETEKKFFEELGTKFQKKRFKDLHQTAFDELGREGKNPIWRARDLKRQMVERQMVGRIEAGMPGPDGILYLSLIHI